MGCESACLGGYDIDGMPEFQDIKNRKARKPFECEECGRTIPVGTVYQYHAMKFDGEFSATKTCLQCVEIAGAYSCADGAIMIGSLWQDIRYFMFPTFTTGCLDKLSTAAAKALILEKWREWKGIA